MIVFLTLLDREKDGLHKSADLVVRSPNQNWHQKTCSIQIVLRFYVPQSVNILLFKAFYTFFFVCVRFHCLLRIKGVNTLLEVLKHFLKS